MQLAQHGWTDEPVLASILMAKQINQALGGAFVAPWEVDQLDECLVDALRGLVEDLPEYKKNIQKVDDILTHWRNSHPSYRK